MASAAPKNAPITQVISCHAWNANKTKIAICPGNSELHIYEVKNAGDSSTWTLEAVLKEHDQLITCLDWAPQTNRILSCSQDRNAYVWSPTEDKENPWKPTLVLLRINRAATCCRWSPDENKFSVGSGTKQVSVCYFEKENDWWVSKMIKKHKSTVLSVAWSPKDNTLLATGSSDFKCRIFNAFIKGVDKKELAKQGVAFGQVMNEYQASGWVHSVAWSPSGSTLAFASHDSSVSFVNVAGNQVQRVATGDLPYVSVAFLSDNSLVAAGHDYNPTVFCNSGSWTYGGRIDVGEKKAAAAVGVKGAFERFQTQDKQGQAKKDSSINTKHQSLINTIQVTGVSGANVTSFSTSGLDGRVITWPVADISKAVSTFKQ